MCPVITKTPIAFISRYSGYSQLGLVAVVLLLLFIPPVVKSTGSVNSSERSRPERFVLDLYHSIDQGAYDRVAPYWIEADWQAGGDDGFQVQGIKSRPEVRASLADDYGTGGWRLRFIDLETRHVRSSRVSQLPPHLKRERQILEHAGWGDQQAIIVGLQGHTSGRCSIHDWQRELVLVETRGRYRLVLRGVPPAYQLLHREQLFFPRDF